MYYTDGVFYIDEYGNSGAWFFIEFADLSDVLKYVPAQMLLDQPTLAEVFSVI